MSEKISDLLIKWYQANSRDLPWRHTTDPYKIWLSEIILQQTRVAQGMPYYLNFIEKYPSVSELANAPEDEVMRLWQGLGYYSRARNLHACAKTVVQEYNTHFPDNYNELLKLKGVGKYTAAAIASFAFQEAVPVVDGNVYRVLSRVFLVYDNIAQSKSFKIFYEVAESLIPQENPADFNQAMMELGATICKPQNPLCDECPIAVHCLARIHKKQSELPVKQQKLKIKNRYLYYLIWEEDEKLAMKKRGPNDIWQGLFDFELIEKSKALAEIEILTLLTDSYPQASVSEISEPIKHVLSHQKIEAVFIHLNSTNLNILQDNELKYYSRAEVEELPKPRLIQNYLTRIII